MAFKSRIFFAIAAGAFTLSANVVSAVEIQPVVTVSMEVKPQSAVRLPGGMLSLDVRYDGTGPQPPISVSGAPEGTSIEVLPQSDNFSLVSLVFPWTAVKGMYTLFIQIGSTPLLEQKIEVEIGG